LLTLLEENWPRLCDDIERGKISVEHDAEHSPVTRQAYRPLPRRAELMRAIFAKSERAADWIPQVWPSLALVSCWADGPSAVYANELRNRVGGVEIQAKGLLATEAFVSIPRVSQGAPVLAVRSHFFEFQPADAVSASSYDRQLLADELTVGREYRVIVTTSGGLYRYQLHDQVLVVGFEKQAPLLRFVGKADSTSDLVGEKLSAAHVQSVLDAVFQQFGLNPAFARLVADPSAKPGYALQISVAECSAAVLEKVLNAVEQRLCENPGYAYAREVGQLSHLTIDSIDEERAASITSEHVVGRLRTGQRLGDIKPSPLVVRNGR
jgi:hypothetical protein